MSGVGALNPGGINPLRRSAGAAETPRDRTVVSVEQLKNGGALNFSTGGASTEEALLQRSRYIGRQSASSQHVRQSNLSVPEQIEELKKIKKAAQDYEAVFMNELVKAMRQSPLTKMPGGDIYQDLAEKPFTGFLAEAGGLGLADQIVAQVARQEGLEQTLQNNPGIMGPGWQMKTPKNHLRKAPGRLPGISKPMEHQGQTPLAAPAGNKQNHRSANAAAGLLSEAEIAYLREDFSEN